MAVDPRQQKQNIQLQNDYNEALKMSQSISSAINSDLDKQIDKRTKLGKKVKDYITDLQSSITKLEDSSDIHKLMLKNEDEIARVQKNYFGANKKVGAEKIKALKIANDGLKIEGDRLSLIERVDEQAKSLSDSLGSSLDGFTDSLGNIPLFGGMLEKVGKVGTSFIKEKLSNSAMTFTTKFAGGLRSGMGAMQSLKVAGTTAGRALMTSLAGPQAIIAAIVIAIAAGIKRFMDLDKAAQKFRESTGLLNSQTTQMVGNIKNISSQYANLGVSADDVASAAADFTNEFSGLEQPSREVLGSMVTLNKNFGIGTQEASKLNKVFQNIGGLTATQSQYLIGQTAEMAKMAGVAPDKVIKDMADNSEYAYRYFQGSPEELAKAAVQAAKLGTSIKEAGKVADNLLDFESSITKELEASAILGTNINLGQSRYLASTGDILGAQQAVVDEVSKLGDITKLNKWQQDALVEATGMEFDSLVNQQRIRERFGKLNDKQLASAMALVDAGKDINKLTQQDLNAQTKRLAQQKELQSVTDDLNNEAGAIGTAFMDMLAPIGEFIMPILRDVTAWLGAVLVPTFKLVGNILSIFVKAIMPLWNFLSAIVGGLFDIVGSIISVIADAFGYFADLFSSINDWFTENIVNPIKGFFDGIASFISSIGSFFSFDSGEQSGSTPTQSVNDGVMQDGKVITTSPEDFLIATKNPSGLADAVGGGGVNISMDSVIAELRELKQAFLSNKDVYMDSVKVTSVVRKTTERSTDNNFGIQSA